jgi:hypothetical protein
VAQPKQASFVEKGWIMDNKDLRKSIIKENDAIIKYWLSLNAFVRDRWDIIGEDMVKDILSFSSMARGYMAAACNVTLEASLQEEQRGKAIRDWKRTIR